jgi:hypothetical protein
MMRNRLFVFGRLADDPEGVLAGVDWLACVGIERGTDFNLRGILGEVAGFELSIATFTDAEGWWSLPHDPQFALRHDCSLAHWAGRAEPLWK